ncbi:MAG: hypothetical protein NTV36_00340, partial [Candidatus Staskawiczbacteria bacterium]|nr:hypothetical protein [Candidatus Staskawiczbacteria bacterium]
MNKTSKLILTGVFLSMMAVLFFVAVAPSKVEATNYPSCTSHASKKCANGNLYWFDSCGKQQELAQDCGTTGFTNVVRCDPAQATRDTIVKEKVEKGCSNNACFANSSWVSTETNCLTQGKVCRLGQCVNIACRSNADCGVSNPTGSPSCQGENMYQNYTTYTCVNPGAVNSSCTSGTTSQPITVFSGQAYQNIPTPGIQHTSFGIRTTTPTVTTTQSGVNNATMKLENLTSETKVINYRTWSCRCKEKFGNDAGACTKFWDGQTSESAYQATSCQAEEKTLTLAGNETKNISLSTTQYNNNVCGSIQDDLFFLSVNGAPAGGTFDGGALFMGGALSYFCNDCQVTPPPPPPPP